MARFTFCCYIGYPPPVTFKKHRAFWIVPQIHTTPPCLSPSPSQQYHLTRTFVEHAKVPLSWLYTPRLPLVVNAPWEDLGGGSSVSTTTCYHRFIWTVAHCISPMVLHTFTYTRVHGDLSGFPIQFVLFCFYTVLRTGAPPVYRVTPFTTAPPPGLPRRGIDDLSWIPRAE